MSQPDVPAKLAKLVKRAITARWPQHLTPCPVCGVVIARGDRIIGYQLPPVLDQRGRLRRHAVWQHAECAARVYLARLAARTTTPEFSDQ